MIGERAGVPMLPSYPKVQGLGPRVIIDPAKEYYVEEKVDGSQFSFGVRDGEVVARSKGAHIDVAAPPALFAPAVASVLERAGELVEGYTYRAEALAKPKHNTLTYSRVPAGNLVVFDVENPQGMPLTRQEKEVFAAVLDYEVVPVLYRGRLNNPAIFSTMLECVSFLGAVTVEGVVVKSDVPEWVVYGGQEIRLVMKYVSEAFKEIHSKSWKTENPDKRDAIAIVTAALRTEARWAKAVQHLRDEGRLTGTVRDIGALINEVQDDVFRDDADEVARLLLEAFKPILKKTVGAGLAEWYKQRLLEEAVS